MDNKVTISFLLKVRDTCNQQLLSISKSIWNYLLFHQIMITAENLPSQLNVKTDWKFRNPRNSSEWKLLPFIFQNIRKNLVTTKLDLFASGQYHHLPNYVEWKPNLNSIATGAMQQSRKNEFTFVFPPFSMIGQLFLEKKRITYSINSNIANSIMVDSFVKNIDSEYFLAFPYSEFADGFTME